MKPAPLSADNKTKLIDWLRWAIDLVESDEISGVAAYLQKTNGGGDLKVSGELVRPDAITGLSCIVERIQSKTQRLKVVT